MTYAYYTFVKREIKLVAKTFLLRNFFSMLFVNLLFK